MKKIFLLSIICAAIFYCEVSGATDVKVLVVYFSQSGNTEAMAKIIEKHIRGKISVDSYKIIPSEAYPDDYSELRDIAQDEKYSNARPKIKYNTNINKYDTIFIGYPIWWGTTPMIIRTFLEAHDFGGKKIYPFNTHGGSGKGTSVDDIKNLLPRISVGNGFAIQGSDVKASTSEITKWVDSLKISGTEKSDDDSSSGCNVGFDSALMILGFVIFKHNKKAS